MTNKFVENVCTQLIEAQHTIMEELAVPLECPIIELDKTGVPLDSSAIAALALATHQLAEVMRARTILEQSSVSATYSSGQEL